MLKVFNGEKILDLWNAPFKAKIDDVSILVWTEMFNILIRECKLQRNWCDVKFGYENATS